MSSLVELDNAIKNDRRWKESEKIQRKKIDIRKKILSDILNYYAYQEVRPRSSEKIVWNTLIHLAMESMDDLHKTNIHKILSDLAYYYLKDFSYSKNEKFYYVEKDSVELEISPKAWNIYWKTIDIFKNDYLFSIRSSKKPLFDNYSLRLQDLFDQTHGTLNPLSPFRYGIPVLMTMATIITDANALMFNSEPGVAAASLISGYVGLGVGAVYSISQNNPDKNKNSHFINILKDRLAKGEINKEEYLDLKKTIENPDDYD